MITRFETLAPDDSLQVAAELLLATHQQDFPVVDAWGRVVGVLSRSTLLRGLAEHGPSTAVLEVMDREIAVVQPSTRMEQVLGNLQGNPVKPVLVIDDGTLVGMVTLENVAEFIEITRRTPTQPTDKG
jgi:CBS domain-containing protein